MRLGLFGGSFDPIHRGHVEPVREARRRLGLERVIFLPTAVPPHKPDRALASAAARYAMVEMALLDEPDLEVSDFELTPDRACHTVDTLRHFAALEPNAELVLLIGEDSYLALTSWVEWREIVARAEIGILARPGAGGRDEAALPGELIEAERAGRIHRVENEAVDVSSSAVRRTLARRQSPAEGELPALVLKYLEKYPNLYA